MKIAVITITYNDGYKFKEWCEHYEEYKDEIDVHIIVDNGSEQEYLEQVKAFYINSIIIERATNGGCTGAYNDGLRIALEDKDIDAVMLIGNDITLPKGNVTKLYNFLHSNENFGMVSPVLLKKDEDIIELYGAQIHTKNLSFIHLEKGKHIGQIADIQVCDGLPGGMNMASREFYEKVGMQDEFLFMYADEVDMGIRGKNAGFQFAATKYIKAWHQHINPPGHKTSNPMAAFLMGRNVIYLVKKHCNHRIILSTILQKIKHAGICNLSAWFKNKSKDEKKFWWWYFKGVQAGIFNQLSNPFIEGEN